MIQSKEDYLRFLENDKKALYKKANHPSIIDYIWKYERLLRKTEYYVNCRRDLVGRAWGLLLKYRLNRFGLRLGYTIPINVCDEGLSLVHYGNVTINLASRIGKNCRIYNGVVIGSQGFGGGSPTIGNNVMIGAGAKVLGDCKIYDGCIIGANAVVTKDVPANCTVVNVNKIISRDNKS